MDVLRRERSSSSILFDPSSACRVERESVKIIILEGSFSLLSNDDFRCSIVDLIS